MVKDNDLQSIEKQIRFVRDLSEQRWQMIYIDIDKESNVYEAEFVWLNCIGDVFGRDDTLICRGPMRSLQKLRM